jgi:probable F420-dependent oxidoreductase
MTPKLLLVLSENWAITGPDDLRALVRIAIEAEQAGIDGVMVSEHIVLGRSSGAAGVMANPRDYAAPGNQAPDTSWPSSIVLLSAIAAVTQRLRLVAGAVIAPLRHPLLLAKELASLDLLSGERLVVLPTVSWHEEEYAALGVRFADRGSILDEQLEILSRCWRPGPVSFSGRHFSFEEVWVEPRPRRASGPELWFGGQRMHPALLRRLVRFGSGFNPFGTPSPDDLAALRRGLLDAGRDPAGVELIGGIRGRFTDGAATADLDEAFAAVPAQIAAGFTTICVKPAMYIDDVQSVAALCRDVVRRAEALTPPVTFGVE